MERAASSVRSPATSARWSAHADRITRTIVRKPIPEHRKSAMSRCSWRFLFVRFPYQTAGDIVDVRQAAGDGFAVDADLGGRVHLREPAHDIKLHDLPIDLIQYSLVSDVLLVPARHVFQPLRQGQARSDLSIAPFVPAARVGQRSKTPVRSRMTSMRTLSSLRSSVRSSPVPPFPLSRPLLTSLSSVWRYV